MKNLLSLTLLSCLACLSACSAVGPTYQTPAVALPERFATSGGTHIMSTDWWQEWQDAQLTQLIDSAQQNNPDITIALARIAQARAAQGTLDLAGAPNLGVGAKVTSDRLSKNSENFANFPSKNIKNNFTNHQIGFDASWELDFFGRQQRISEAAKARSESSVERLSDVRVVLAAEVARHYLELRGTQARLALARYTLSLHTESVRKLRKAQLLGEITAAEFEKAKLAMTNFDAGIYALEQSHQASQVALSSLTTQPLAQLTASLQRTDTTLLSLPVAPASGLPSSLLQRRPDIRGAERELAAATADVGIAQADLYPRFSLLGTLGWSSVQTSSLLQQASQQWSLGPQISLPLLNRSKLRDHVASSEAQLAVAQANYRKTVLAALADTEIALSRLANNEAARMQLADAVSQQNYLLGLSEKQNQAGEISQLSVLEQRRAVAQQQDALLQSQTQSLVAMVALYKALGGGW